MKQNDILETLFRPGRMSEEDFATFSSFIYNEVGIKLPRAKKTMVEARLHKRLRFRQMKDYSSYLEYLYSPRGQEEELTSLIDVVTTNTTDFFREPKHFEMLSGTVLPEWMNRPKKSDLLRLWSAGCSTGMEPYTLAMVLNEFAVANPPFRWSILATDISTQALAMAQRAIYEEEKIRPVPKHLLYKYFLRSKDRSRGLVRVSKEIRESIDFRRLNFMEDFSFEKPMSIIFCRNVVIYFDKKTQAILFNKFCQCLEPGGYLFIGHSESLSGMDLPLIPTVPTVYKRI